MKVGAGVTYRDRGIGYGRRRPTRGGNVPQRDIYHDRVKRAPTADGWTITHDPYTIAFGSRYGFIDLGAERTLAAERAGRKFAVEIKSFVGPSPIADLGNAVGQYLLYRSWLARTEPDRERYLAIDPAAASDVFQDLSARVLIEDYRIMLLVVDVERERVEEWRS